MADDYQITPPKPKAADLRAALTLRYPAQSHALMFEVAPATGGGTRYADAVAVGLWRSHGHQVEGFEIKVARSDWLHELKQPGKSEPVMRYCHRWWLVCTPGVAKPDELPPGWGMMELQPSGTLKARVRAGKLDPVPVDLPFFASLVRRGCEPDNAAIESLLKRKAREQYDRIRAELIREGRDRLSHRHERAEAAIARLEAFKERTGIDLADYSHGDEWFRAADLLYQLGGTYGLGALRPLRDGLRKAADLIEKSGLASAEEDGNAG